MCWSSELCTKHKRCTCTKTNYLLVNLALSDVITILLGLLYFFSLLHGYLSHGFGNFICKFLVIIEISVVVSSFTLTVLAVERYHALMKPFRTGIRINDDNIRHVIALIWIASTLFCMPFQFSFSRNGENRIPHVLVHGVYI